MQVSLIRRCGATEAGTLDAETGRFELDRRLATRESAIPAWLPEVPAHGFFDTLGGLLVAVYRLPRAPETLWLQLGARRFAFANRLGSQFTPDLEERDGRSDSPETLRTFTLLVGGRPVARHCYRVNSRERRAAGAIDPFPLWPEAEENHDLLYFAHRVLADRAWPRVLAGVRRRGKG